MAIPTLTEIDDEIQEILNEERKVREWLSYARHLSDDALSARYSISRGDVVVAELVISDVDGTLRWEWPQFEQDSADDIDQILIRPLTQWALKLKGTAARFMLTTAPRGEIVFNDGHEAPEKREAYIENAIVANVVSYLAQQLEAGRLVQTYESVDGTTYTVLLMLEPGSPRQGEVPADALYSIAPSGRRAQIYAVSGALNFSAVQLTNDRVKLTGRCSATPAPIHDHFAMMWIDVINAFGPAQQLPSPTGSPATSPLNVIADVNGGTVWFLRNERRQVLPVAGAVNEGYVLELGRGVAIRPETQESDPAASVSQDRPAANLPHSGNAEQTGPEVNAVSERTRALNDLAVRWVRYNQTERISRDDGMEWFLGENAAVVGLDYVSMPEFKKHLPKACEAGLIDKDKKSRRYVPKRGT